MTASFGITALNELQELYNGKSIREDGQFALEVLKYINDKVNQFKQVRWISVCNLRYTGRESLWSAGRTVP